MTAAQLFDATIKAVPDLLASIGQGVAFSTADLLLSAIVIPLDQRESRDPKAFVYTGFPLI